jgi:hypothetical protein
MSNEPEKQPVRLPDELERVQKPTGGGPKGQPPHSPTKQE